MSLLSQEKVTSRLTKLSRRRIPLIISTWRREFPFLPSWPTFISHISSSPQPYRRLFPANATQSDREEYTRALYWLLAHDLVIQAHEYVRIVATAKIKVRALQDLTEEKENKKKRRKEQQQSRRALAQKQKAPQAGTARKASDPSATTPSKYTLCLSSG